MKRDSQIALLLGATSSALRKDNFGGFTAEGSRALCTHFDSCVCFVTQSGEQLRETEEGLFFSYFSARIVFARAPD